jgi:hypothetical protein
LTPQNPDRPLPLHPRESSIFALKDEMIDETSGEMTVVMTTETIGGGTEETNDAQSRGASDGEKGPRCRRQNRK